MTLCFHPQVIDQLDKKRKVFQAILDKGTALTQKPKSPEFLGREVKRASDLWKETNNQALDRLQRLKGKNILSIIKMSILFFSQTTRRPGKDTSRSETSFSKNLTAPTQSSKTSTRFKHPFLVLPFQKHIWLKTI